MITHHDLIFDNDKNLHLDLFLPETESFDLFIYFHGGGLSAGNYKGFEMVAKTLTDKNIAMASVEYSLYPNAKYPDFIVDAVNSIRWLKDNISAYGKCKRIFVGGSSAGGYISMMLCFDKRWLNSVGLNPTDIAGFIHDAGQPTTHFKLLMEDGLDHRRLIVDERAPMYFVGVEENYPPMLFLVSTNDMPCRYEQTKVMIKLLDDFGHKDKVYLEVPDGRHCEHTKKVNEDGESVFANYILKFINTIS